MNNRDEKITGGDIVLPQSKIGKFFDNLWYHYKWHIIIIGFFVTVFVICFVQCATTVRPDIMLTYAGPYQLKGEEKIEIDKLLTSLMKADTEEDSKTVATNPYAIYSEEELRALYYEDGMSEEQTRAANTAFASAKKNNMDAMSNLSNFLMTGESAVLFVSEWLYTDKMVKEPERMMPLKDVLGIVPESAFDGYVIRLSETDLYREYAVLQVLPEDTLIILMQPTFAGKISDEATFAFHKELFCKIVATKPE